MRNLIIGFLLLSLSPVITHTQPDFRKIPVRDTFLKKFVLLDLMTNNYDSVLYNRTDFFRGSDEDLIMMKNDSSCLLVNKNGEIVYQGNYRLERIINNTKTGTCLILANKDGFGLFSLKKHEFIVPVVKSDLCKMIDEDRICFIDNASRKLHIRNIITKEKYHLRSVGQVVAADRFNLRTKNLISYSCSNGKRCLVNISTGVNLYFGRVSLFYQLDEFRVAIKESINKIKIIRYLTGGIESVKYEDIQLVKNSDSYYVLKNSNGKYVYDISGKLIFKAKDFTNATYFGNAIYLKTDSAWIKYDLKKRLPEKLTIYNLQVTEETAFLTSPGIIKEIDAHGNIKGEYIGKLYGFFRNVIIVLRDNLYFVYSGDSTNLIMSSAEKIFPGISSDFYIYRAESGKFGLKDKLNHKITLDKYEIIYFWSKNILRVFGDDGKINCLMDNTGRQYVR